jgi:phosphate transport system permease protein
VLIALAAYGLIIATILMEGIPALSWELVSTIYSPSEGKFGILNDILGTFLLMVMTSIIALPVGIGSGIFMSEYGGRFSGIISFSTTLLRSMSVVILGIGAYTFARYTYDTPLESILSYPSKVGQGTFLLASIFLALLVIPIIARATEEGFRSLPRDLREGSLATGATEGYTLLHVLLPWSFPNILTGMLLGCAEVAGSVAVIMLIAGVGNFGVGPLTEVTSLAHFVFKTEFYTIGFVREMGDYKFTAALILLIITLGLTILYLVLRNKFAERYRGAI